MNKKIKFLSGAFLSITTIPLIAASCDNKSNNSAEIITKPQTDHMDGGNGDNKNIPPPFKNGARWSTKWEYRG
ncbi:variable surface lipoprotein [Mycoplasmopsis agalactiae]|uniref:variable surface lipoprotein n=1 Tax=Mycoplasmopsis agalactiae TaxID=2110 RepID=UPI001F26EEAE|nr:variable surface lipoprotein [Mycoplasmopsis agalactiae]MCE6114862.1 variable surface lipoprotein [Mycoplasmopsis agalactiae]